MEVESCLQRNIVYRFTQSHANGNTRIIITIEKLGRKGIGLCGNNGVDVSIGLIYLFNLQCSTWKLKEWQQQF